MSLEIHSPRKLLESLCALPRETPWVEFKENKFNEDLVGQYVSSLANSAMLESREAAYLVFGVRDFDHEIVGTSVDLLGETVGTEQFIFWLNKHLEPRVSLSVEQIDYDGKRVEILCIDPAYRQPVKFKRVAYVRIGSAQQPLGNYPERERSLWQITSRYSFETSFLKEHLTRQEILEHFAIRPLMKRLNLKVDTLDNLFRFMTESGWIKGDLQGRYEVSALLAIAASLDLNKFPSLENKGARLLVYRGKTKLDAIEDLEGTKGHLVTFISLLSRIMTHIPSKESLIHGVRKKFTIFQKWLSENSWQTQLFTKILRRARLGPLSRFLKTKLG